MGTLSIIIPAYNEATRIEATLESIVLFAQQHTYEIEVIVVTNNTTDGTREIVEQFHSRIPVTIFDASLHTAQGGTKGRAVKKGVLAAHGTHILYMDADNAVELHQIETFWQHFDAGYDVVFGSRYVKGAKTHRVWYRDILGRVSNLLVQAVLLPGIKDTQCGFKCFTNTAGKKLFEAVTTNGWGFDMEVLALARKAGYKLKEAPVEWHEIGHSAVKGRAFLNALQELFAIRRKVGKQ
jgi:dolichyl-phosphate beta-glucosyltransferase